MAVGCDGDGDHREHGRDAEGMAGAVRAHGGGPCAGRGGRTDDGAALGGQALPGMDFSGDGGDAAPVAATPTDAETAEAEVRAKALSDWLNGKADDEGDEARRIGSRTVTGRELVLGSAFSLTGETAGGGTAGFWGRAAVSGFDGREGELTLDGEVTTGLLGADYGRGRWLMGLIASHSRGEGSYRGSGEGTVSSTLTGVHPWARYAVSERLSVWGAAGYGEGTVTLEPDGENQTSMTAELSLAMAAAAGAASCWSRTAMTAARRWRWRAMRCSCARNRSERPASRRPRRT